MKALDLPHEGLQLALTLALSFLLGLEREQRKGSDAHYLLGGIRTFPLIGLLGYGLARLAGDEVLPVAIGFLGVTGMMALSYRHKLATDERAGMTTEISALATYLVGALVCRDHVWIAAAVAVASVLLLELKEVLEGLTRRVSPEELQALATFLLLSAVILPIVPNEELTRFRLNPYKAWLAVVAASGLSYGSYLLQKLLAGRGGILLSGLLGGAYSSTITTVTLARQSGPPDRLYSGAILVASGVMYLRLLLLLLFFNRAIFLRLVAPFCALGAVALVGGWLWSRGGGKGEAPAQPGRNPLQLRAALLFALVFLAVMVASAWASDRLGPRGMLGLAAILGVADVDPFILGVAQGGTPAPLGSELIVLAAATNNVAKAVYAALFAHGRTRWMALGLLLTLAALGALPLLWLG
jgi:uncharacterized membrane protein (DUF4010 family)